MPTGPRAADDPAAGDPRGGPGVPRPRRSESQELAAAGAVVDARVREALLESTRTDQTLSALHRAVEQLGAGLASARSANERLAEELAEVRNLLARSMAAQAELEEEATRLALERDAALATVEEQRRFLTEQQDLFLEQLLEEHERERASLEAELARLKRDGPEAVTGPAATQAHATAPALPAQGGGADMRRRVESLERERDRARETLRRLQAQRDLAQAEAERLRRELAGTHRSETRRPPPTEAPAPSLAAPRAPEDLRRTDPMPRQVTPPPELASALTSSERPPDPGAPPRATTGHQAGVAQDATTAPPTPPRAVPRPAPAPADRKPPLPRKPDPAKSNLGSYSLAPEEVEDHVPPARLSSRPPRGW